MLVLSRRLNEKILLPGVQVAVQVVAIKPGAVRLGIQAPPDVTVLREEVPDRAQEWGPAQPAAPKEAEAEAQLRQLTQLMRNRTRIARTGLAQLRRQLEAGATAEALETLARLEEDLDLLRQRLDGGVQPPAPRLPARRALLVEDNANERELLASFLRRSGIEVTTAADGEDALDTLKKRGRPDVVLLDMGLPRCDGPTAVRAIRRDPTYAGLKIFAVTGHVPDEFDLSTGPAGIDRWFQKPINPVELVQNLNQELDRTAVCRS